MIARHPPVFTTDPPGAWGVDFIGGYWYVIHRETLRAKKVGRVGSKFTNYFDRALQIAAERNKEAT